jgi:peptidyl-prolyl cis-trans isomerase C
MRVLSLLMIGGALWAQAPAAAPAKPKPAAVAKPAAEAPAKPAAAAPAKPATPLADPVVFTSGAAKMTKSEFDNVMKNLPDNLKSQMGGDTPDARRRLAEQLSEVMLYAGEARKLKLDQKPQAKVQFFLQQESTLAALLFQHLNELNKPTEAVSKAWYETHKGEYEQAKARHILIRFKGSRVPLKPDQKDLTEEEALAKTQAIRERLVKGEDFAVVAKAESDDTGSGAQGGDLGTFGRGRMVPVFEDAAFSQAIGAISEPVKSPFGYHLIQVQERNSKSFEEVRPEIEKKLQGENAQKAMEAVKNSSKPVLDEGYFGKPAVAKPPAAPPAAPVK